MLTGDEQAALLAAVAPLEYRGSFERAWGGTFSPEGDLIFEQYSWCGVASFGYWVRGGTRFLMTNPQWPDFLVALGERVRARGCPDTCFSKASVAYYPAGNPIWGRHTRLSNGKVIAAVSLGAPALLEVGSINQAARPFRSELLLAPGSLFVIRGQEDPEYWYRTESAAADRWVVRFSAPPEEVQRERSAAPRRSLITLAERVGWPWRDLRIWRSSAEKGGWSYRLFSVSEGRLLQPATLPVKLIRRLIGKGVPVEDHPADTMTHEEEGREED